ncbi:MAG TPA: DUF3108 domain-containing protein [Pyrinomonadaceae bacterium]|nr:DUF3108 domain-containing protein [Chloracidobacterium sp.]MBP9108962.1 DUF3108 domain-containing protein [Pyrinomonadaceae bacterium]MBK7801841.1 DUF3108 domain-containing protein [Chloracidobacterium sp.]MBK9438012.1 DUF3108 domain-containing protein [Chloracidobacterium sp.]MBK9765551.1 DUF3108 domain-containing protein [Chloracidobacterium sp.]
MLRTFRRSIVIALLSAFAVSYAFAQAPPPGKPAPFKFVDGEAFRYEGKLSKIIQGLSVAELKFDVSRVPDTSNFVIKTEATSKGTLLKLFRFSFLQQYESVVDGDLMRILKTTKHDVQKERVRDSIADFDYSEGRVTYIETDPLDPNRPPRRIASEMTNSSVYDLVSGIYALRSLPLAVGASFDMLISDSGLIYKVPIRVTAREIQKSELGKIMCFRVEPLVFGKDRLIEQKGNMLIWITDDARRIPVRGRIDTTYGKIEVKIKSVTTPMP